MPRDDGSCLVVGRKMTRQEGQCYLIIKRQTLGGRRLKSQPIARSDEIDRLLLMISLNTRGEGMLMV
jgi:hypothetical protein